MIDKKSTFKNAWPYQKDKMNLPVRDVDSSINFYESIMGFRVIQRNETPVKSVVLGRDDIQMGLAENGGDPSNDGCFIEVNDVQLALEELQSNGLGKTPAITDQKHGDTNWKVFFVTAPDELCYCIGEKQ